MGVLFIFILISVLVVSTLLFFNKGEKAQEIKSILKDICEDFKLLFSNFKKLFLIVKELIQANLDQEQTQLKDDSSQSEPQVTDKPQATAKPQVTDEPQVIAEINRRVQESMSDDTSKEKADKTIPKPQVNPETKVKAEPETIPTIKIESPSEDLNTDENTDIKTIDFK